MNQSIIEDHQLKVMDAQGQVTKYEELANKYSIQRLVVFGFLVLSVCFSIAADEIAILIVCFAIAVFWFAWLVKNQNKYETLKIYYNNLKRVNENEIESITKRANIYYDGALFIDEKHFYTADLDIFGSGSLFQFINRSATLAGNFKLADWLKIPADKPTILLRQNAVKELAEKPDWKLNFQTRLLFGLRQPGAQVKNLIGYLKTPVEIKDEQFLYIYSQITPFLLLLLIVLSLFYPAARYFTGLVMLANNRIASSRSKLVKMADLIAGKIGESLNEYSLAFECIENENWHSDYNAELAKRIKSDGNRTVSAKIKELSKLINKLNNRLNLVVGFILNVVFIWDVRQIIAIERWKRNNHESLEIAFDVIGGFEALISLSSMAVNYPDWAFPTIAGGAGYTLKGKNIAHPLITTGIRVANDFELDDAFKIDIITGSNMAGKSTFLRTLGINAVLGLCGAPVCADSLELSVIRIITYMRIKDSLNESTSTFKAELDRLQMLLAAVEQEEKVYFLIDEMLRGTNSVDKYLGSKAVIKQLIHKKGVGQVATHDLQIARLEDEYPDYVRNYYFDIQVLNGEMLFDYRIKHGECKTFNASILLRQIGINVD